VTDLPRKGPEVPSAAACAEAAAWIARLHGENRTLLVEAGFKRWLAASSEHRTAFEMANEVWSSTENVPKPSAPPVVRWPKAALVITFPRALAVAIVIAAIAVAVGFFSPDAGMATRVGEQRNFTLEDGTRVSLNTASRIHVNYNRQARRVDLEEGEAYFEVAKRADWPFIVTAGGKQVVARGTAFLVRRDEDRLAVTLVEGKVTVAPAGSPLALRPQPPTGAMTRSQASSEAQPMTPEITLSPGQRLTFVDHERPKVDQPVLERVTAWQRGQVILDHTSLADAVAEMNRYSGAELRIEEPDARRAQVTGIFRLGDSVAFAQAVAETYHLSVAERDGAIVLSGHPQDAGDATTRE